MFSSKVRTGEEFADLEVVRCYAHRAPYPAPLFDSLLSLAAGRELLLDLGCGPGKLAIRLADAFSHVSAIDPSPAMLSVARALGRGRDNITWICARAEDAELDGRYDLVVAGAAIHWMQPQIVMPKLAERMSPGACLALVDGDGPTDAPWIEAYRAHVVRWVEKGGGVWGERVTSASDHRVWLDVQGEQSFGAEIRQSVADLIEAEHSRATWSRAAMGDGAARAFDDELRAILEPHAIEGLVSYGIRTRLTYGLPLAHSRTAAR